MKTHHFRVLFQLAMLTPILCAVGCQSPYHADKGAVLGGLFGAGTGAIVGNQVGNPGAGAAIGAGLGALGGAAVGNAIDESEARNRAAIAQQLGRQVAAGAVTIDDVIAMASAGVSDELIVNHVRAHGMAAPLQASDLILLQQQGVSTRVVSTMQETPRPAAPPVVVQEQAPTPVIVEEYHYSPYWGPRYHRPYRCHPRPGMSWGVSVGN